MPTRLFYLLAAAICPLKALNIVMQAFTNRWTKNCVVLIIAIARMHVTLGCYEYEYNTDAAASNIVFVTSFGKGFYENVKKTGMEGSILHNLNIGHKLIVYHEDDVPVIEGVCMIDMRVVFPWMEFELKSKESGLNKYFSIATYTDPMVQRPRRGIIRQGAVLMLKVAAIDHAVRHAKEGTLVMWVDTDTTIRRMIPPDVFSWLMARDITYIPLYLEQHLVNPFKNFDFSTKENQLKALQYEWWRVESGTLALNPNNRTRELTRRALGMYRGGLYELAQQCFNGSTYCRKERIGANCYGNDVFVWSLLLHADSYKDEYFHVDLKHGWFAMDGVEPWGPEKNVWGSNWWPLYFKPAQDSENLVTNFNIGNYVFHHFGVHKKGALSIQFKGQFKQPHNESESWRFIEDPGIPEKSLYWFIGTF